MASGCVSDPPHDNPVDPESPGFRRTGDLKLHVTTVRALPIQGAIVRLLEIEMFGETDSLGIVELHDIPTGDWLVVAYRDNNPIAIFNRDTIQVEILSSRVVEANIQLTAIEERGNLSVRVLTLREEPIEGATVMLSSSGRFGVTDVAGLVRLDLLPIGQWWVSAFRDGESDVIYGTDSLIVNITSETEADVTFRLDALPNFSSAQVLSITEGIPEDSVRFKLHLKVQVEDPDGQADLTFVKWTLFDTLQANMQYLPDSAFWWSEIAAESLPVEGLDGLLGVPFLFEAFDQAGRSSISPETYIWRVIHETPLLRHDFNFTPPRLYWIFFARDFNSIQDSSEYNQLVRVWNIAGTQNELYINEWVAPDGSNSQYITIDRVGLYIWEVFVVDRFGNMSRSSQDLFEIESR